MDASASDTGFSAYAESGGVPRPRSAPAMLAPGPAARPRPPPVDCGGAGTVRSVRRFMIGNGPIDNRPLNVHVTVMTPKNRPAIVCQRFHPVYGMLVAAPAYR